MYGTLRIGTGHPQALALASSARHVGAARVRGCLFRIADYPGLVGPETEADWVNGDLFEGVSEELLKKLDDYEGSEYRRHISEVIVDFHAVPAFLYHYVHLAEGLERVVSGDWLEFSSKSSRLE